MNLEDRFNIVGEPDATTISSADPTPTSLGTALQNSEVSGKLLYSKSKVYVHPKQNATDFIPGFISIVEKASHEYLIAWTPEALIPSKDLEAFVQVDSNPEESNEASTVIIPSLMDKTNDESLYVISSQLDNVKSIIVHPPSFTKWYGSVVLNFNDGTSSAPLWFHDEECCSTVLKNNTQGEKFSDQGNVNQMGWGGDEFIHRLSQLTSITPSDKHPHLYLLGQQAAKRSTGVAEAVAADSSNHTASSRSNKELHGDASVFDETHTSAWVTKWKELRWNTLEKLSHITRFSRSAVVNILDNSTSRQIVPFIYPQLHTWMNADAVRATTDNYGSARLYLAKWAAEVATRSDLDAPVERRYRHVGIWGHGWEDGTALGVFEVLNSESDSSIPTHTRSKPISEEEWKTFFDEDGKLSVGEPYALKRIFCGGLVPAIRSDAWMFLTHVFPWESTAKEREQLAEKYRNTYKELRSRWMDDPEIRDDATFQDQKYRIDKDVHRTDRTVGFYSKQDIPNPDSTMTTGTNENLERLKEVLYTYCVYNRDLGYAQGMSDLLSPLYMVIQDDLVFQAFIGFMERTKSNFTMDLSGMHRQLLTMDVLLQFMDPALYKHFQRTDSDNLFFCFRWFLVWFKRELSSEDTLTLWEVLWTDYLTDNFIYFVALAILDQNRDSIIDYLQAFDEIIKYINDLSMNINLQDTLQRAEILFYQFKQRVEAVDAKREKLMEGLSKTKEDSDESRQNQLELNNLPVVSELLRELLPRKHSHESDKEKS